MTLAKRWPNGVASMNLSTVGFPQLGAADLAFIDQNEQLCLDKSWFADQEVHSTLIFGDGTEGSISLVSPTSSFLVSGSVTGVVIVGGGSGYSSAPSVNFTGGGGSGATGTAVISGGSVVSITITDGGVGYTSLPTVVFGSGSASATAVLSGAETTSGGRFKSTFPLLNPAIPIGHFFSTSEMFSNIGSVITTGQTSNIPWPIYASSQLNWAWYVDFGQEGATSYGSMVSGTWNPATTIPFGAAVVPITRIYDRASNPAFGVYFKVASSAQGRSTALAVGHIFPTAAVFQYDPFLNVLTNVSTGGEWYSFLPIPATLTKYYNSGTPNQLLIPTTMVVDISKYIYFIALLDESYAEQTNLGSALIANEYNGIEIYYSAESLAFQ